MEDFQPDARIVADSISPSGDRLTTIEVKLHRFVLAELNTHRALSRSSASSRAIPVHKNITTATEHPAVPLCWAAEQRGMQGGDVLSADKQFLGRATWLAARDAAVAHAATLIELGVHKSIVNRLLEPFLGHTVVITATDYDGFFAQRCTYENGESLAQPEMTRAADLMLLAYKRSVPAKVALGEWHLPYVFSYEKATLPPDVQRRVSAARCARTSYLNQAGRRSVADDEALYRRLVSAYPPHASPLEHVATPAGRHESDVPGNFTGWHQLRHIQRFERTTP